MDIPAELQGFITAGVFIASAVIGIIAYLFKRPESTTAAVHGAAIIDSSEIIRLRESVMALTMRSGEAAERQADALEKIAKFLIEKEARLREEELETLRREVAELRRVRRGHS